MRFVPFLPNGIVVEYEHGERQIVTDCGVEISDVHHKRCIRREVGDPLAWSRKASAQCDA
jgi:hypothetical protein